MTLWQFEQNFEAELEEEWNEVRFDFVNWDSFVFYKWKQFNNED